jgi:hypothetical protein
VVTLWCTGRTRWSCGVFCFPLLLIEENGIFFFLNVYVQTNIIMGIKVIAIEKSNIEIKYIPMYLIYFN